MKSGVERTLVVSCTLLLSVFPLSAVGQGGASVRLRMKFKPGETSRYQTIAQIVTTIPVASSTSTLDVSLLQQMRVNKALPNEGGEVATSTLSGRILMNGQPLAAPESKPILTSYGPQGNILAVKGTKNEGKGSAIGGILGSGALSMQQVYLPSGAVKPGSVWTQNVFVPGLQQVGKGTAKATFLKVETVGRYRTAKMQATLSLPLKILLTSALQTTKNPKYAASVVTGTLNMTFDSNFAIAEGKVIRSAGRGTANVVMKPMPVPPPLRRKTSDSPPTQPINITLTLRVGNNLME